MTRQARAGCLCPVLSGHNVPRRLLAQHCANMGWSLSELDAPNCMTEELYREALRMVRHIKISWPYQYQVPI